MQDILDFDVFFKQHADEGIDTGIRLLYSMTFKIKDAVWWNIIHPHNKMSADESQYEFYYKLSMYVHFIAR